MIVGASVSLALASSTAGVASAAPSIEEMKYQQSNASLTNNSANLSNSTKIYNDGFYSISTDWDAKLDNLIEEQLFDAFQHIESIPDEILAKDDPQALQDWYYALPRERVNWIACGAAIGLAVVTNFSPAKLIKIKSAIKTVGGAVTFAKKVSSIYKKTRLRGLIKKSALNAAVTDAAKAAGPEVQQFSIELFNSRNVYRACFE
ncbi:hypothetical protein [Gleimia hominis]|uniref:hypothetical protein n=1 Tax=Gleimia hominis TaxID=595468 RepID=UPI000C80969C|nr:hypothetical protein [Gleimia hominis]WIK64529.1 hypothetical protein CJ187_000210 [Gleimia hominis]